MKDGSEPNPSEVLKFKGQFTTVLNESLNRAQSIKSPIGVPLYWESGANPTIEWQTWFSTFKMAVMAKENMHVDHLLRLKPTAGDLLTEPTFRIPRRNNSVESRKRQHSNNLKKWQRQQTKETYYIKAHLKIKATLLAIKTN